MHSQVKNTVHFLYFLCACALALGGCNQAGRDLGVKLLPDAHVFDHKDQGGDVKTLQYQGWMNVPGDEQLKGLVNPTAWTPLKTDALGASGTLFTWLNGLTADKKPVRAWLGQWQDERGDVLIEAAHYNPDDVTENKVKTNVAVIKMPAAMVKKMMDREKARAAAGQTTQTLKNNAATTQTTKK